MSHGLNPLALKGFHLNHVEYGFMRKSVVLSGLFCLSVLSGALASNDLPLQQQDFLKRVNGTKHLITEHMNLPGFQVGIMDTGFDVEHPVLKERVKGAVNFRDHNKDITASIKKDARHKEFGKPVSHGTHVAGIVAQLVPPMVSLNLAKCGSSFNHSSASVLTHTLDYLIRNPHIKICNFSFHFLRENIFQYELNLLLELAKTKLVVISAGNYSQEFGKDMNTQRVLDCVKNGNGNIIVVGASEQAVDGGPEVFAKRYSNRAGVLSDYFITAPGTVQSAMPLLNGKKLYDNKTGTSMAAPIVSGLLANILAYTGCTIEDAREALFSTASQPEGQSTMYGKGFVNFDAAFEKALELKARRDNSSYAGIVYNKAQIGLQTIRGYFSSW